MLEYFIATPGARKGLVDTALRTADSGYLTRRLVDVAQELIITRGPDCEPTATPSAASGSRTSRPDEPGQAHLPRDPAVQPVAGRRRHAVGRHGARAGHRWSTTRTLERAPRRPDGRPGCGCARRSPDEADSASAAACYGLSLATGKTIELGEAVGVIAAQSIGEPGTQLTMRTFHTGGIAGGATSPAVCPASSSCSRPARPKGKATLARTSGVVRIAEDEGKGRVVTIVGDDGTEETLHRARLGSPRGHRRPGDRRPATPIVEGPRDPKELLEIKGVRETQQYLVERGPEGVPRPGRVDPRQAHRAHRAPDDPPGRRAGAGRLRLPARRAGRPEGLRRHQPAAGRRRARRRPRAVPS